MKVSLKWLSEYVDVPADTKAFCDRLDLTGTGVEAVERTGAALDGVVVGHVLTCEQHPDSDHMHVVTVDVGAGEPVPVSYTHLVEEGRIDLSSMMKKILLSYSHYFNRKYDRRGYLFQDRYKSKPIEGDEYLLSVVRYIHRNPLEVGQTTAYWTSFDEYMETPRLADTERVLEMLDADPSKAKSAFRLLVESESDGGLPPCGIDNPARLSDREAIMLIREIAGVSECAEVCSLDKARREEAVLLLRVRGLSIRQISRLTGLSKGIVERARAGKGQLPSG